MKESKTTFYLSASCLTKAFHTINSPRASIIEIWRAWLVNTVKLFRAVSNHGPYGKIKYFHLWGPFRTQHGDYVTLYKKYIGCYLRK